MTALVLAAVARFADRFTARFSPVPDTGCYLWTGALDSSGYGTVKVAGAQRGSHIVAWELVNGPVPPGLELDHRCRVRACGNAKHLELVTHTINVRRSHRWPKKEAA